MAEAVAALSLAANILQVLDFGKQFAIAGYAIYHAGPGSVEALSDLQSSSSRFHSVLTELQKGAARAPTSNVANGEDGILVLASKCSGVLKQMLESIVSPGSLEKGGKRDAAKAAFKLGWKKGDIESLQKRLDQFRDELTLHLVVSLR